jgi:hypothetical protein
MQHRSPAAVFFFSLITFGIYDIVWHVKTKTELNRLGANIPTAWLIIVPLANLYWIWKYAEGVEKVSSGKISAVLALILLLLLSIVGIAILQSEYNQLPATGPAGSGGASPGLATAPYGPPVSSPVGPPQSTPSVSPIQGDSPQTFTPQPPTPPPSGPTPPTIV